MKESDTVNRTAKAGDVVKYQGSDWLFIKSDAKGSVYSMLTEDEVDFINNTNNINRARIKKFVQEFADSIS